ncbi:Rieske 2Fe-2S domain-containing protein [Paraherbaspirillum soli]|uniref:Rieske 2Fe-2S domain-containing protein n=1 Tax=Paraherbaspirillum soli TaxID=631222 RepID=A0ABW0MGG7_9BURK
MLVKNSWYIAAYSNEIKRELFARTLVGEPVLMYRKLDGSIAAIADRCSHRRVSLSRGKLIDDRVQCTYHGLEFNHAGECVRIPGQDAIPQRACIRSYPVAEKDGFVWLWPGDASLAADHPVPDYFMRSSPRYEGKTFFTPVKGDYLLAIENLLDLTHLPHVHPQAFEADISNFHPKVKVEENLITATRTLSDVPNLPMYIPAMGIDRVDRIQVATFAPGGNLRVDSIIRPVGSDDLSKALTVYIFVQVTPETDTTHFAYTGLYRDFALGNPALTDKLHEEFIEVVLQDTSIIEHQQRNHEQDGSDVKVIDILVDHASLAARRIVRRMYEQEQAQAAPAALQKKALAILTPEQAAAGTRLQ